MPTSFGSHSYSLPLSLISMNSVPDSSLGSGTSWLYVPTSWAICWSETIRSTRAISWIWNRMVSVFSNVIVIRSPSRTRRRFFISMMRRRNSSRSRSYSRTSLMSSSVSFCISLLFRQSVGAGG